MDDLDFMGKVAVVTGASRGIGRQLAIALGWRGAMVVGTARGMDSSPGSGGTLRETIEAITKTGGKAVGVPCQITDPEQARGLIRQAHERFGRIDILLNNAGHLVPKSLEEHREEDIQQTYITNVFAPLYLIRAVLPVMRAQGGGNILNVSSGSGVVNPRPDTTVYSSTKAAIDRITWILSHEVKEQGIAVNSWWPGVIDTDMTRGRLNGEPVEVVEESAIWILAQNAETFTGQSVRRGEFKTVWGPGFPLKW